MALPLRARQLAPFLSFVSHVRALELALFLVIC